MSAAGLSSGRCPAAWTARWLDRLLLPLEGQLEWEVQAARELAHLALGELAGFLLGLVDGDEHEILEHLDVLGIRHAWVDPDARDRPFSVSFDRHHPARS